MRRKEITARTIHQDNDAGCHGGTSQQNKSNKRLSNRRLRRILKERTDEELADCDDCPGDNDGDG